MMQSFNQVQKTYILGGIRLVLVGRLFGTYVP